MSKNRPELGIQPRAPAYHKGYLQLIPNKESHVTIQEDWPPIVTTEPSLINLVISNPCQIRTSLNSPYLVSLSTIFGNVPGLFKNLALVSAHWAYQDFSGLRHVRLIRVSGMSCHLNIRPAACLEILDMPNIRGPMYSTSSPCRLLILYKSSPDVQAISRIAMRTRKPTMTITGSSMTTRREPCIIRVVNEILQNDGYLVEEKRTAALIVPPGTRQSESMNKVIGSKKYLSPYDLHKPVPGFFCNMAWIP